MTKGLLHHNSVLVCILKPERLSCWIQGYFMLLWKESAKEELKSFLIAIDTVRKKPKQNKTLIHEKLYVTVALIIKMGLLCVLLTMSCRSHLFA